MTKQRVKFPGVIYILPESSLSAVESVWMQMLQRNANITNAWRRPETMFLGSRVLSLFLTQLDPLGDP